MTYPNSSDVSPSQPTAAAQYNHLRKDAIYLGNSAAESATLGEFLADYLSHLTLEYLATNRLRIAYDPNFPARIMIDGCMLKQTSIIDLPVSSFSGVAGKWYIFANRSLSSTSFTLSVNTSITASPGQRLIGECYWDGSNLLANSIYLYSEPVLPPADYDSGWFAVAYASTYNKAHQLSSVPRFFILLHNSAADGSGINNVVGNVGPVTNAKSVIGVNATQFILQTGNDSTNGTLLSQNGNSAAGYYRIQAWR